MFFAGLKDVEHKPHSVYIDRYPEGREATVAWPSVDLKFTNTTPYGVLIKAKVASPPRAPRVRPPCRCTPPDTGRSPATKGRRTDTQAARHALLAGARTARSSSGRPGFSVDVFRFFRAPHSGKVLRKEKFHTDYIAGDYVRCGAPPKPEPKPEPRESNN